MTRKPSDFHCFQFDECYVQSYVSHYVVKIWVFSAHFCQEFGWYFVCSYRQVLHVYFHRGRNLYRNTGNIACVMLLWHWLGMLSKSSEDSKCSHTGLGTRTSVSIQVVCMILKVMQWVQELYMHRLGYISNKYVFQDVFLRDRSWSTVTHWILKSKILPT
jgi:hypothetical protein